MNRVLGSDEGWITLYFEEPSCMIILKTLLFRIYKSESLTSTCKFLLIFLFWVSWLSWSSLASPICSLYNIETKMTWQGIGSFLQIILFLKFPIYLRSKILRVSYFLWLCFGPPLNQQCESIEDPRLSWRTKLSWYLTKRVSNYTLF